MRNRQVGSTSKKSGLDSGWTLDPEHSAVCRFQHIATNEAQRLTEDNRVVVVETINWTYAEGNKKSVHQNRYFVFDMRSAIALAAQIAIESCDVAEDVVAIRLASEDETQTFLKVAGYFAAAVPDAISEREAQGLCGSSLEEDCRGHKKGRKKR